MHYRYKERFDKNSFELLLHLEKRILDKNYNYRSPVVL